MQPRLKVRHDTLACSSASKALIRTCARCSNPMSAGTLWYSDGASSRSCDRKAALVSSSTAGRYVSDHVLHPLRQPSERPIQSPPGFELTLCSLGARDSSDPRGPAPPRSLPPGHICELAQLLLKSHNEVRVDLVQYPDILPLRSPVAVDVLVSLRHPLIQSGPVDRLPPGPKWHLCK